jgi:hypothetical protein
MESEMVSNAGVDYSRDNYKADDDVEVSAHDKDVRRKLEARLERRRLKEELEDYEGELDDDFEWDDVDK